MNANVQFVAHFLSLAGSQELDRTLFENRRFRRSLNLMHTTVSRESSPASLPPPSLRHSAMLVLQELSGMKAKVWHYCYLQFPASRWLMFCLSRELAYECLPARRGITILFLADDSALCSCHVLLAALVRLCNCGALYGRASHTLGKKTWFV